MPEPDTGWQLAARPSIKATGGTDRRLLADWMADVETGASFRPQIASGLSVNGSATDGAVGDDDAAALQAAINACSAGDILTLPSKGTRVLKVASTIVVPIGVSIDFNGVTIGGTSALDGAPIMTVGDAAISSNDAVHFRQVRIGRIGTGAGPWTGGVADAALRFIRLQKSLVEVSRLYGKTSGLQLYGDGGPCQYNIFLVQQLLSNKYACHFHSIHAAASINQNTFIGGSYRVDTSQNTSVDARGILVDFAGAGYTAHNNNVWENPSFELQNVADRIPVEFNCGQDNIVRDCRHEANTGNLARAHGTATRNQVIPLWSDQAITFLDDSTNGDNFMPRYSGAA